MIKIYLNNDSIKIEGHALYADYGKDIVCASVSSIVITTINALLKIDKNCITYEELNDGLLLKINKKDNITKTLIGNLIDMLKELSIQYKKNIEIIGG